MSDDDINSPPHKWSVEPELEDITFVSASTSVSLSPSHSISPSASASEEDDPE